MYTRIIVGMDGSDRAISARSTGTRAAAAFRCPLEVVHVPAEQDRPGPAGVTVLPVGDPAQGLVAHATATDPPGLVCLSSRGRTGIGEVVFGSVTSQVIRTLQAPLLTVGPASSALQRPWRRMLVCLDGSTNAATILPVAAAWAAHLDLEVQLLYVAYPLGDPRVGDIHVPDEDRTAAAQVSAAATQLQAAGVAVRWSVEVHTDIAAGIVEQADRALVDLIALATHGRTGLARLIGGNVALDVVRRATVPVLTQRPARLR